MSPCEQCVYIRFAFLCIALGGIIATVNPRNVILKCMGYGFTYWGCILGIKFCITLDRIHRALRSDNPFGVQGCSDVPAYPFGMPLDQWFPAWFQPTGECGYDSPIIPDTLLPTGLRKRLVDFYADGWYLWPPAHFMNMARVLLVVFVVLLALVSIAVLCRFIMLWRRYPSSS